MVHHDPLLDREPFEMQIVDHRLGAERQGVHQDAGVHLEPIGQVPLNRWEDGFDHGFVTLRANR